MYNQIPRPNITRNVLGELSIWLKAEAVLFDFYPSDQKNKDYTSTWRFLLCLSFVRWRILFACFKHSWKSCSLLIHNQLLKATLTCISKDMWNSSVYEQMIYYKIDQSFPPSFSRVIVASVCHFMSVVLFGCLCQSFSKSISQSVSHLANQTHRQAGRQQADRQAVCPSVWLSICLSICMAVCLSVGLSVCLSFYLSDFQSLYVCQALSSSIWPW